MEDVPNFAEAGELWWTGFREWLGAIGYTPLEVVWPLPPAEPLEHIFPNEGQICWAVGKSSRGDFKHATLVEWVDGDWQCVHDPHPDNTGLDGEVEVIGMLIRLDGK